MVSLEALRLHVELLNHIVNRRHSKFTTYEDVVKKVVLIRAQGIKQLITEAREGFNQLGITLEQFNNILHVHDRCREAPNHSVSVLRFKIYDLQADYVGESGRLQGLYTMLHHADKFKELANSLSQKYAEKNAISSMFIPRRSIKRTALSLIEKESEKLLELINENKPLSTIILTIQEIRELVSTPELRAGGHFFNRMIGEVHEESKTYQLLNDLLMKIEKDLCQIKETQRLYSNAMLELHGKPIQTINKTREKGGLRPQARLSVLL